MLQKKEKKLEQYNHSKGNNARHRSRDFRLANILYHSTASQRFWTLNSTAADFELFTSAHEEIKDYIKLNSLMDDTWSNELFMVNNTSWHEQIKYIYNREDY